MPFAYPSESILQSFLVYEFIAAAGIMDRKKQAANDGSH